jgi:hypothetical protein
MPTVLAREPGSDFESALHGRAIPLLWQTLERPSASVSAEVVMALLGDRGLPSAELSGWFAGRSRWRDVMRLRADKWIHGTAAPMGC